MFNAVIIIIIIILITIIILFCSFFKYWYIVLLRGETGSSPNRLSRPLSLSIQVSLLKSSLIKNSCQVIYKNFLFYMDYYRFSWILIKTSRRSSLLTENLRFYSRFAHRHAGNFSPGGGKLFAQKILASCPKFFTKQSKRNEGHTMQQHRPIYEGKVFLQMKLLLKIGGHEIR